ncbi:hypothetical protein [Crossiella equi]|uniref:hypothetical protein n=1 Tax=Crossiella equi TaxID=130796 RepID=UPI001178636C|nr:hypothetical protein [Crossiella equi]
MRLRKWLARWRGADAPYVEQRRLRVRVTYRRCGGPCGQWTRLRDGQALCSSCLRWVARHGWRTDR